MQPNCRRSAHNLERQSRQLADSGCSLANSSPQVIDMATRLSDRPRQFPICMLWSAPLLVASALVASARHRHDWEATPIQFALAIVMLANGYSTFSFHRSPTESRLDRSGQAAFFVLISLSAFVLVTRLLFPIPSTPDNDHARINRLMDGLLLWPFVTFSLVTFGLAAASSSWRHSLFITFSAILMLMLALSMHSTSKHWLRSLNSLLT